MSVQTEINRLNFAKDEIRAWAATRDVSIPADASLSDYPTVLATMPAAGGSVYDLIVKTQADFDKMVASATWLDATTIALVNTVFRYDSAFTPPANVVNITYFGKAAVIPTADPEPTDTNIMSIHAF